MTLFTTGAVGKLLGVYHKTVRNWCREGKLKSFSTPGGRIRITKDDLLMFLSEYQMPVPPELLSSSKKRILIVDDEQSILNIIIRTINSCDFDCELETARDGFEAGKKFTEFKPDLVILDIMLPGINGIDVCQTIRESDKNVRIICITGNDAVENREQAMQAGADDFMAKPLNMNLLLQKVEKVLLAAEQPN